MVALQYTTILGFLLLGKIQPSGARSGNDIKRTLATCPAGGVMDPTGTFCCLGSCGTCGGAGCDTRPGGAAGCCTSQIKASCTTAGLPCLAIPDKANPAPNPPAGGATACPAGGIVDSSGKICCMKSCGACGGAGCDTRPGGAAGCCTSQIKASCDGGMLPCIITSAAPAPANPTPTAPAAGGCPNGGVMNPSKEFCCPAACGECGGFGCDKRPGGAGQCCTGQIVNSCNTNNPPCKIDAAPVPNNPNPPAAGGCPNGGVMNASKEFCCPAACGECGGFGCDKRPGGPAQCCTGSIKNDCGNTLPCKIVAYQAPTPTNAEVNCDPNLCKNGGYCVNMNYFSDVVKIPGCKCQTGYSGRFCEKGV